MKHVAVSTAAQCPAAGGTRVRPASVALRVIGYAAMMALAAQVRIPVPGSDVPMTLQSLAMLLTGMTLTPLPAAGAMLLYLVAGASGLPVYAAGSAGLLGPTGGYLAGFVIGAFVLSAANGRHNASYVRALLAGALGLLVLFALGLAWRLILFDGGIGWTLGTGLVPFAPKALVQLLLAATAVTAWRRRSARRRTL